MKLFIIGLGIKINSHLTQEAKSIIKRSDKVFYISNSKNTGDFLFSLNRASYSLSDLYFSFSSRKDAYEAISEKIFSELACDRTICFAIYGHPTFFVQPSMLLLERCKKIQCKVFVLPGVSFLDCLLSDLGINPGEGGLQVVDCSELLLYKRSIDIYSNVVLVQPFMIGNLSHERDREKSLQAISILKEYLIGFYKNSDHPIYLYKAARTASETFSLTHLSLSRLSECDFNFVSTLYIPPKELLSKDLDMVKFLRSISLS